MHCTLPISSEIDGAMAMALDRLKNISRVCGCVGVGVALTVTPHSPNQKLPMSPVSALTLLSLAALGLSSVTTASQCGDCWCIPGNGGNDECPDWQPQDEFSPELLADLKAKKTLNPFDDLTCNPYKDEGCVTTPEQVGAARRQGGGGATS